MHTAQIGTLAKLTAEKDRLEVELRNLNAPESEADSKNFSLKPMLPKTKKQLELEEKIAAVDKQISEIESNRSHRRYLEQQYLLPDPGFA